MSTNQLIANLQNTTLYPHPVKYFKLIETHISWVILTGDFAYKIKKPVDFGFLNFTNLSDRKHFCEEELRLNQTAAPELYLDIVPISGSEEMPKIGSKENVIEYAIKMREFSQKFIFSNLLKENKLTEKNIIDLASNLAELHKKISTNPPNDYLGTAEQIYEPVKQNFDQIHELLESEDARKHLALLNDWAEREYQQLYSILQKRKQQHFVRECHGDVHLGNAVLINNKPMMFDCLEFNESFRWTDTMADVGFMIMDLHFNQRPDLANIFLNHYLIHSNDYAGLQVLIFYQAYRTMVRAKVKLFEKLGAQNKADYDRVYQQYIHLAEDYAKPGKPFLMITHGISGSGKSTVARKFAKKYNMIHLASDVIRKKIAGFDLSDNTKAAVSQGIYQPEWTEKTYTQLQAIADEILTANYPVIVDATFLKQAQREKFINLAKTKKIPFYILSCHTDEEKIFSRINKRESEQQDFSEANVAVAKMQLSSQELLTSEEQKMSLNIDMENEIDVEKISVL